ncbi:unnamed protein product [Rotaria magnacalcarata]|uniref:Uncharacterized protein n=1 Tax=Rotaria magnacalcarata TaxID=392030 RepID=A0A8S2N2U5_9BILA|nr:unnamed protein product [Rotaria magnacalcarata]
MAHGEYLMLDYRQGKQWQYEPELSVIRVRPIVFIDINSSINNHTVYVAGGFNINPISYKPYIVPDLQLFNQVTQSWQYITTILNLELTHESSFEHHKLHASEIIEMPTNKAYPKFANKTFANWTFGNGEIPEVHWRMYN